MRQINPQAMITDFNSLSPISETYRMLRTNLQFLINEHSLKVLSIVSANSSEGKTTTLVNLAITFASEGKRVILIDGDMRRSFLHQIFQLDNEIGLSSLLRKRQELKMVIHQSHISNIDVITAGPSPINPSELLGSMEMNFLLDQLKSQYDLVLIDSPPLLVADSKIIASKSDGVIILVRSGKTRRGDVLKVKLQLESVNVNILGVVLNNHKAKIKKYYYQ